MPEDPKVPIQFRSDSVPMHCSSPPATVTQIMFRSILALLGGPFSLASTPWAGGALRVRRPLRFSLLKDQPGFPVPLGANHTYNTKDKVLLSQALVNYIVWWNG